MTVYVDELRHWGPTRIRCFQAGSCHLTADTLEELREFASYLGLRPSWFQRGTVPHYDLTLANRRRAISLGAVEKTAKTQARERIRARQGWRNA